MQIKKVPFSLLAQTGTPNVDFGVSIAPYDTHHRRLPTINTTISIIHGGSHSTTEPTSREEPQSSQEIRPDD